MQRFARFVANDASVRADAQRSRHQKLKLVLDLPNSIKPEDILSEGEQRVIAIGSFFAELSVAHHRGAAVFDDPVSPPSEGQFSGLLATGWRTWNVTSYLYEEKSRSHVPQEDRRS